MVCFMRVILHASAFAMTSDAAVPFLSSAARSIRQDAVTKTNGVLASLVGIGAASQPASPNGTFSASDGCMTKCLAQVEEQWSVCGDLERRFKATSGEHAVAAETAFRACSQGQRQGRETCAWSCDVGSEEL
eukprot:TRINITY_DN55640_c0_g1_i1.p1 TRINITY_DN55640_c0_g1~~TRINITY_DN55640_c0_g1_i1.p1  ORF type:complete len:132 (-),score=23.42 TRINITY_DN55640_c0_g1_i1:206-601(-)